MKKPSKKTQILKYKVTYPTAKPKEIAERLGIDVSYVTTTLSAWRKRQVLFANDIVTNTPPEKMADIAHEVTKGRGRPSIQEKRAQFFMRTAQTSNQSIFDAVNHPEHYKTGGIETIDFIEAKKLNYNLGNVIKYITRADHKGLRKQDLEKAMWYLQREISKS